MKPSQSVLLISAIALCAALVASIDFRLASAAARPTLQEVTEGVTCQCGCGLTVANCNHPDCSFSIPIKKDIAAMLARGMSPAQILALYRAKYGEKILSAPTTEGFNLLAWLTPFAVLLLGALSVVATIVRWVEPIRASTALTTEADALVHVPEKHALAKARGDTGFCDKACPREGWGHAPLEMKLSVSRVRSNEIRSSPDKQASTKSTRCGFVIRAILASSPSRGCVSVVRMLGAARGKGAAFFMEGCHAQASRIRRPPLLSTLRLSGGSPSLRKPM